jgi:hypothetical protein
MATGHPDAAARFVADEAIEIRVSELLGDNDDDAPP